MPMILYCLIKPSEPLHRIVIVGSRRCRVRVEVNDPCYLLVSGRTGFKLTI